MRVLVVSTSGAGHITPLVPLIDALVDAGDEVLVLSGPEERSSRRRARDSNRQVSAKPR